MNDINNRYEYELYDRFGMVEVAPLNEGDFTIDNEQEADGKYFYTKQFGGKFIFTGTIFRRLLDILNSMYICADHQLKIYRTCGATRLLIFDGIFHLPDGDWDEDRCTVTLKFEKEKPDRCLDRNKSKKINLLAEISNRITVKSASPAGTLQTQNCTKNSPDPLEVPRDYWCLAGDPLALNWSLVSYRVHSPDGVHNFVSNTWAREIINVPAGETPDPDWVLISGTQYAKRVQLINCVYGGDYVPDENNGSYDFSQDCEIAGYSSNTTTIDNGMLLSDIINVFKNQFCPTLNVVSDFLQINPENASNINYVTGQTTETNKIVIWQKSDVKRPTVSNNASKAEMTFDELVKLLATIYNIHYSIIGNVLRFEHISWFSRTAGLDLTLPEFSKYVKSKRKYTFDLETAPTSETWSYKEQFYMGNGLIQYNNLCTVSNKENAESYVLDFITGDVNYCLNNPESDSNKVTDEGFVIMATRYTGGQYYIIGGVANSSLSWTSLIPKYHYYNRPLKQGIFNGQTVTFQTTKPIKKGTTITVPLKCGTTFDPMNTVKTPLGVGIVEKSSFRLRDCMLELDILYNVFDNLSTNSPPTINGGVLYGAYAGTPFLFDIITSDSDGTIVTVQVKTPPSVGTLEILSLTQGRYTPPLGHTGLVTFGLRAIDDWGESTPNSQGNFGVMVRPPNQPPVAVNDNYTVYQGIPFNAYVGVTANDSDDNGFTIVTPNVVTTQGVAVSINATGNFSYTPPVGFEGDDTFVYTIADDAGATSSATVTLSVIYRNKPFTVNDNYSTPKNTALTINGTTVGQYKLITNDYTPDGSGGALFCTAETKATTQGGTVTIQTSGLFTYTPPANYTGQDSFTYTANNTNGSRVGTAFISVIPTVYVRLEKSDVIHKTKTKQYCDGLLTPAGDYDTCDYTFYFYADAGQTTPLNVDANWGLRINYREHYNYTNSEAGASNYNIDSQSSVVSGTSFILYNDFIWNDKSISCAPTIVEETEITTTLLSGAYIII